MLDETLQTGVIKRVTITQRSNERRDDAGERLGHGTNQQKATANAIQAF